MANKPEEFPLFTPVDYDVMYSKITDFVALFEFYSPAIRIDWNHVKVSTNDIADIVDRVEKRRVYFHVYYNGCTLGEMNEVALQCFWLIKMMPFHHSGGYNNVINVKYAVYFFLRMIQYVANKRGKKANITKKIAIELCYAFRYRDLSKESLMHIAESLIY